MKNLLSIIVMILMGMSLMAKPVDPTVAVRVAQNFAATQVKMADNTAKIVYTHPMPNSGQPAMYVVNVGSSAFVIVAADDIAHPVLGYSMARPWPVLNGERRSENGESNATEGSERASLENGERAAAVQLPSQVSGFLDDLASQIQAAQQQDITQDRETAAEWQRLQASESNPQNSQLDLPDSVGPLLTTTWDQGQYYNALCPEDANGPDGHALTGCVATAMAQIINYWGYPVHGRGTHSYNVSGLDPNSMCDLTNLTGYGTLYVNYDSAYYDFDNMPDVLTSSSTTQEINAVAQLMYHCGVGVNMFYDAWSSGAYEEDVRSALISYFGFVPSLGYANRQLYTDVEWENLLRSNIDRAEPVFYCGSNMFNAHAFVLDGYNQTGFFHFNFGWSGNSDGWFLSKAVNVGFGFDEWQSAIMGIRPDNNSHTVICHKKMHVQNRDVFNVSEPIDLLPLRGGSNYYATNETTGVRINLSLIPDDSSGQLALEVLSFDNEQSVAIYDGANKDSLIRVIETRNLDDYSTVTYRTWLYEGLPSDSIFQNIAGTDLSPLTSSRHGFTIVVYSYGGMGEGFRLRVRNQNDSLQNDTISANRPIYWTDVVTSEPDGHIWNGDTIRITTAEGLAWVARCLDSMRLNNINYSDYFRSVISIENNINLGRYLWKPILEWYGNVEGNGYVISDMTVSTSTRPGGLFSSVREANISDVGFRNCKINSTYSAGPLVGQIQNCSVFNCWSDNHIISVGNGKGGGLMGEALYSKIDNCYAYGNVYAQMGYGGLIGYFVNSQINNCVTQVGEEFVWGYRISPPEWRGLFTEEVQGGSFTNCFADISEFMDSSVVLASDLSYLFLGNNYHTDLIDNTAAFNIKSDTTGMILTDIAVNYTLGNDVDVITALNNKVVEYNSPNYKVWIRDSVTHLPVLGDFFEVTCPNVSNISAENITYNGDFAVALSWQENGDANEWQIKYKIDGTSEDNAVIINTNVDNDTIEGLILGNDYVFYVRPICDSGDNIGWGLPLVFYVDKPLWIDVVSTQPVGFMEDANGNVTISSPEGLAWLAKIGFNYRQDTIFIVNDLDMGSYRWTPIGRYDFMGIVEGYNHIISNLYCREKYTVDNNDTKYLGLFGNVNGAFIKNITIADSYFSGYNLVGGLFGSSQDVTLNNCHVVNTIVKGMYSVGGIGGNLGISSEGMSNVINCSSTGVVYGNQNVGGLMGGNGGNIINCFSRCQVLPLGIGNERHYQVDRGGMVGSNAVGTINNCYNAGEIGFESDDMVFGTCIGEFFSGEVKNVYSVQNDDVPFVGRISGGGFIEDTSILVNDNLQTPVTVSGALYSDILSALNAWLDAYDTLGIYRRWAADSAGTNGGYPVFEQTLCPNVPRTYINQRIDACNTYTFNDVTYTESFLIRDTLLDANGCDSISMRLVLINHPLQSFENVNVCEGQSYTFNGRTLTETGYYYDTIINGAANGCDSIVCLWLEVQNPTSGHNARVCEGQSYTFNGRTLTETNSYYDTIFNGAANGCDSIVYLWLEVQNNYSYQSAEICQGDSYSFAGQMLTESGTYFDTLTGVSANGCDSIVQLNFTVHPTYYLYDTVYAPENSLPYLYTYHDWTQDVDDFNVTMNSNTQIVDTRVNPSGTIYDNGGSNGNYSDNFDGTIVLMTNEGETIKLSGNYQLEGCCDYIAVYDGYGTSGSCLLYTCGDGSVDVQTSTGYLTIRFTSDVSANYDGFALQWNTQRAIDTLLTATGDYTFEAYTSYGCDNTFNLHLEQRTAYSRTDSMTVCSNNLPYTYADTLIADAGTYTFTYLDQYGIDSTVTLHLTINHSTTGDTTAVACDSFTWWNTNYTNSTNEATHTLTNAAGCDSVVTLHLTINNPVHTATTEAACESYTWNGSPYTASGDYTYNHLDVNGCTQVDTLHLTINNPVHTVTTEAACESYTWNGTAYAVSGDYTYGHTDNNCCTQVDTLHLTINNPVHMATTEAACETYTWNGTPYTSSGNYTYGHADNNGCTQVDTLHLTVNHSTTGDTAAVACDSFTWWNTNYTNSTNEATHTLTNAAGCDSVVTLHLTINHSTTGVDVQTACDSYTWIDGNTYTESNFNSQFSILNSLGCDSTVTLNLTVNNSVTVYDTLTIGSNELPYDYYGNSIEGQGNFTFEGTTSEGCDSTMHLFVIVNQVGIDDVQTADGITLFPNPTSGTVTVSGNGLERVEVMDVVGRTMLVVECQRDSEMVDLSELPQGAYVVRIATKNGTAVKRVVKK